MIPDGELNVHLENRGSSSAHRGLLATAPSGLFIPWAR